MVECILLFDEAGLFLLATERSLGYDQEVSFLGSDFIVTKRVNLTGFWCSRITGQGYTIGVVRVHW